MQDCDVMMHRQGGQPQRCAKLGHLGMQMENPRQTTESPNQW